jgi:hypothetical protein
MFIFAIDQELWTHELMDRIMGYDNSLGRKDILKFVYHFIILFLTVYILKQFLLLVSFSHLGKYSNVLLLILIIFYLNLN